MFQKLIEVSRQDPDVACEFDNLMEKWKKEVIIIKVYSISISEQ